MSQETELPQDTTGVPHTKEEKVDYEAGREIEKFYPFSNRKESLLYDTVFSVRELQYDPARKKSGPGDLHAGYLGSPIFQTSYRYQDQVGMTIGHHNYAHYKHDIDTLAFYDSEIAYSDLFYAQGPTQLETQTEADFGTSFKNQYLSIRYRRINNTGPFQHQRALHTSLGVGYFYEGDQHHFSARFGSNVIQDRYNQGITTDTLFGNDLAGIGSNIPVRSTTTEGRHHEKKYALYYAFFPKGGLQTLASKISLNSTYSTSFIKVFDNQPTADIYGPFFIDDRGLRQFIDWSRWSHQLTLSKSIKNYLKISAGIEWNQVQIFQEPRTFSFHELFAHGNIEIQLTDSLSLESNLQAGIQDGIPEYKFRGSANWKWNFLDLSLMIQSSALQPDFIQRSLFLRNEQLYSDFNDQIIHNQLGGSLSLKNLNLSFSTNVHNFQDFRYFTTTSLSPQKANISILQLSGQHKGQLGFMRFNTGIEYQVTDQSVLPLPEWQAFHQLFADVKIFKKHMHLRTGLEGRAYLNFNAPVFQPFYGTFFVSNSEPFDSFPFMLDYFLSFHVQSFQFMARIENLSSAFTNRFFYSHQRQPYSNFGFRLGIRWRLNG